jgi:hypothetical protein
MYHEETVKGQSSNDHYTERSLSTMRGTVEQIFLSCDHALFGDGVTIETKRTYRTVLLSHIDSLHVRI